MFIHISMRNPMRNLITFHTFTHEKIRGKAMKHMAVSENDVMVINQWIYHDFDGVYQ